MNRISLSGLRAIEAAARLGTLNAAADELGVTAGALSQRIARTEAQLGQPVFDRSGQSLRPTELGRDIAARLTRGMSELSAAVALADPTADTTLTISVAPLFASRWLVWRLPRFSQAHPGIRVRIEPASRMVSPGIDGIDIGLRIGQGNWPGLRLDRLMPQRFFPVCAPALADRLHHADDLRNIPVIRENARLQGWQEWLSPHRMQPDDLPDGPELADGGLCLNAAISGQGVFMAWAVLAADALTEGTLIRPLPGEATNSEYYWLATAPESHRKPAIGWFRTWLRQELAASLGKGDDG
ncbi:LysR substrate-binding domain-containing protein [Paracoccus tegillarcae]|uniref:LysR substrate-binding domain-containing protein n=1 Tax=Paracoccus tegillarcae TaxID=1529068 RepID=UPI0018E6BEE1|nr:LysR substrate-binding domain-containing protein [Paracoccus tegillarcae]